MGKRRGIDPAAGHNSARPWRGFKRDNWEGGHRVPFIARWPGTIRPGQVSNETICLTDIMATCAAVVGATLPNDAAEDSVNILPALVGEKRDRPVREYTLHQTIRNALGIRRGPWKLLAHKGSGGNDYDRQTILEPYRLDNAVPGAAGQLYNLGDDPGEVRNLYNEHPKIVAELSRRLGHDRSRGRSALLRH